MHNSKLLETIKHFDLEELESFDRFVRSPFFYADDNFEDVVRLFEHIRECLAQEELEGLEKEVVYQHVYPNTTFVPGKLDKLMSRLLKVARKFLEYQYSGLPQSKALQLLARSKFYQTKHLDKRFRDTIEQLRSLQASNKRPDRDHFLNQFMIEKELTDYDSLMNNRKGDFNLQSTLESIDIHYIVNKLHYTSMLLWQNIDIDLKLDRTFLSAEEIDRILEQAPYLRIPLITTYCKAIILFRSDSKEIDELFYQFKTLLQENRDLLPLGNLKAMQAFARNYGILQYNKGNIKYLKEVVDLYKEHLAQGYLYYENKLVPNTIFNIVQLTLRLKEYDWIKDFLESHKKRITGTQHPEEVYRFNMANYYFHIRDFNKALDLLSDQYEDTYYNIAARRLEIKIYFEEQSVLLDSKMDAFKVFTFRISRKLLSEVHKTANNNFINFLRQINNPKTMKNDGRINKLIDKIREEGSISEKTWLLEKLEELR